MGRGNRCMPLARGLEPRSELAETIGDNIRTLRLEAGLSLADLARAAGRSVAMISGVEAGRLSAGLGTVEAVAKALAVPAYMLLVAREGSPPAGVEQGKEEVST